MDEESIRIMADHRKLMSLPEPVAPRTPEQIVRIASLLKQADDALLLLQTEGIPMSRAAIGKIHKARATLYELEVFALFNEPIGNELP